MKKLVKTCIYCGRNTEISVTDEQAKELASPQRRHIQDILPDLAPEIREMFISGLCSSCYDYLTNPEAGGIKC